MLTTVKIVNDQFFMNDFIVKASKSYKKILPFWVRSFVNFHPVSFEFYALNFIDMTKKKIILQALFLLFNMNFLSQYDSKQHFKE